MWRATYIYDHSRLSGRRYGVFKYKYYDLKHIKKIIYYFNENRHRIGKPAILYYNIRDNRIEISEYYINGQFRRSIYHLRNRNDNILHTAMCIPMLILIIVFGIIVLVNKY